MAASFAQALGGKVPTMSKKCEKRSYREIIAESEKSRNILEIIIQKPDLTPAAHDAANTAANRLPALSYDDFADFVFEHLKVNPKDCKSFNYSLSNFGNKEVGNKEDGTRKANTSSKEAGTNGTKAAGTARAKAKAMESISTHPGGRSSSRKVKLALSQKDRS